jgi:hypothetical protein
MKLNLPIVADFLAVAIVIDGVLSEGRVDAKVA